MRRINQVIDRIKGTFFGCAIGDALGWPVEFKHVQGGSREVTDLELNREGVAFYTDDTQMTRAVAEGLIHTSAPVKIETSAEEVAEEIIAWLEHPETPSRAPGTSCLHGARQLKLGVPWREAGKEDSKGCGAVMRSSPYGLWWFGYPRAAADCAAAHSLMTHRHPASQAASAAFAAGIAIAAEGGPMLSIINHMITAALLYDQGTAKMLAEAFELASIGRSARYILDMWRGWTADEAIAASAYCFARHHRDYEAAVLEAVNSPGDSDSLGAITGALTGAHLGIQAIPKRWVDLIEKRDELMSLSYRFATAMVRRGQLLPPRAA